MESDAERFLPAMGISSGLHLIGLVAMAAAVWAQPSAPVTMRAPATPDLSELLVQPIPPDTRIEPKPEPPLDPRDPTPPDLTGSEGERTSDEIPPSVMPPDVPEGALDQSGGGDTRGGLGGDLASLDREAGRMLVDLVGKSRFQAEAGDSRPGVSNRKRNPFGPRSGGPGGPELLRRKDRHRVGAIARALDWLKRHQAPSGAWTASFGERCGCAGTPDAQYDVGLTSLASLAFLAHGESPGQGTLGRAVAWLRTQQSPEGRVGSAACEKALYNHALATMVLAEAAGTRDFEGAHDDGLSAAAQRAADWLVAAQNHGAGWRYRKYGVAGAVQDEGGINDTSVTGWCVMALKDARTAGLSVPDSAFQGASAWLDAVREADPSTYQVTYGYTKAGAFIRRAPETTTSVGLLSRLLMGQSKDVEASTGVVLEHLPSRKSMNLYYWYYGTLAMFQVGGKAWSDWFGPLKATLLESQERLGCAQGSWDPAEDAWGQEGGRVYATAMGALCLESVSRYYRGQAK